MEYTAALQASGLSYHVLIVVPEPDDEQGQGMKDKSFWRPLNMKNKDRDTSARQERQLCRYCN